MIYKIQGLSLLFFLATLLFVSSCKDDDEVSSEVILNSFGPSGVHHGDEISFIGLNLDKVSAIVFEPGVEVSSSAFKSATSKKIIVVVPQEAEAGLVKLKTPAGEIVSKTILNFEVPVIITSITEEAKPGTVITITGDKINWIESVTFTNDIVIEQEDFVSQSLTELKVTVPMEAQSGFLIFSTGGTEPLTFGSEEQLIVTLPTITGISPSSIIHTGNITITGTDLDLVTSIKFMGDKTATEFVSQDETEIVVSVPAGSLKGTITLNQASPITVMSTQEITIILPIGTSLAPKPAKPGIDIITITGTNLDLVKELTFLGADAVGSATFVTHSPTQIKVLVPAGAKSGSVAYKTIHDYSNNLGVTLVIPSPGPPPLAITLYDDQIFYGGGNWSWGGTATVLSTEQFYAGEMSFKHVGSGSDGGASVGGMTGVDASGQGVFKFSIYGGANTNGKQCAAVLGSDGNDKWDSYNSVTLVEGQWTEFSIPLSNYPTVNLSNVTRWIFKVEGSNQAVIYVDRVGFDPAGPSPLPLEMYDDVLAPGGGDWGWEKTVSDPNNTEQVYSKTKSWKFETTNSGGVSSGGINPKLDASAYKYYTFALYGGAGTDGKSVGVILNDKWNGANYHSVVINEGEWTVYKIAIDNAAVDWPDVDMTAVERWAFKLEGMAASTIYVDRVGFTD